MKRSELRTVAASLLLVLLGLSMVSCSQEPKGPPNILFLFADDQRADTIGAWGNSHIQTPNVDSLVQAGFSFRSNYCLGSQGGAVCVPSRAMVNSGRSFYKIPMNLEGEKLLPELLGENGYVTFATGKWHNQRPSWQRGFQRGKNIMFGGMSNHLEVPLTDLLPNGELGNERTGDKFSSVLFADAAVEFLTNYKEEKPFYAYIAFTAPHDPRQPPVPYREQYYENRPPLPKNFLPQHPFDIGATMTGRDENLGAWPRTEEVVSDQLAEYYGLITHLDEQIGRVLEALKASGKADNTIIIYAADHGLAVGSHGLLGKQSVYEHSMKCPLIFVGPGIPKGQSEAFTYLLDIFPTLTSMAGVPTPTNLDGHDLSAIWSGAKQKVRDHLFLGFTNVSRAIRDEQYKLIRYPQIDYTQLFDLKADPDEMNNLADDPAQKERIGQLTAVLQQWQQKVGDDQALTVEDPKPAKIDLTGHERKPDKWQPQWIIDKYF